MTNKYHATPYNTSETGFYFSTYDDYIEKAAMHREQHGEPVEEYEIQLIQGENSSLFKAAGVNQANLKTWFEDLERLDSKEAVRAAYLIEGCGCDLEDAVARLKDVYIYQGTIEQYVAACIREAVCLNELFENPTTAPFIKSHSQELLESGTVEFEFDGAGYVVSFYD